MIKATLSWESAGLWIRTKEMESTLQRNFHTFARAQTVSESGPEIICLAHHTFYDGELTASHANGKATEN